MLRLGSRRRSRRPSLTPMIDVVFLLLVFFMLAARFGVDMVVPLKLAGAGGDETYSGPPRLIDVLPDGLRLNGSAITEPDLARGLAPLVEAEGDIIVLRAVDGAVLQRLIDTVMALEAQGYASFVMME